MAINLRCCGDLLKAALKKCFPCVRAFSDDPIQQSMATPSGYTVLHLVVCDFPILEYILPKTLKYINYQNSFGNTPLYHFLETGTCSLKTVELLISSGADVNIVNKQEMNSLSFAATLNLEIFKCLLNCGAKSIPSKSGFNVLLSCARCSSDIKLFKYILENCLTLNVDPVNDVCYGNNILHYICKSDNMLKKILSLSSDTICKNINQKDEKGLTPLMRFLEYYNASTYSDDNSDTIIDTKFLKTLLSLGADPLIENKGKSCIDQTEILIYKKIMIEFQDLPPF